MNLESVIILENKLSRVASNVKQIKQLNFITANQTAINAFSAQLKEVVDICEDYWLILRNESELFCHLPTNMFKDNP